MNKKFYQYTAVAFLLLFTALSTGCKQDNYVDWRTINTDWLSATNNTKGYTKTASGLYYKVIREGGPSDKRPNSSDYVVLTYKGTLIDGTVFDEATEKNLGRMSYLVKGLQEGLLLMRTASEYEFIIPYDLGYGSEKTGVIPGYSVLKFRVILNDSY